MDIGRALSGFWNATGGQAIRAVAQVFSPPAPPAPPAPAQDASRLRYAANWEAHAGAPDPSLSPPQRQVLSVDPDPRKGLLASNEHARSASTLFGVFEQNQGDLNACGTTSLGMVMSFWKNQPDLYTKERLDPEIRQFDMPSSPYNLVEYARAQGFRAAAKNHSSLADIKHLIDQGVPPMVLLDPPKAGYAQGKSSDDSGDLVLHYAVVTDYTLKPDGSMGSLILQDPQLGRQEIPAEKFSEIWGSLKVVGQDTGLSNMLIAVAPDDATPVFGKDGKIRQAHEITVPQGSNDVSVQAFGFDVGMKASNALGRFGNWVSGLGQWAWKSVFG